MTNENNVQTMVFQDTYTVQLTPEQEEMSRIQCDIYDTTYNSCLDVTLVEATHESRNQLDYSIDKWMQYIQYTFGNGLFGYEYMKNANPIIIYGALVNLQDDLQTYQQTGIVPSRKLFNNKYRGYSIILDPNMKELPQLLSSPITINLPILGEVKLVTALDKQSEINLQNSLASRILRIDVIHNNELHQNMIMVYKMDTLIKAEPLIIPEHVGLYLLPDMSKIYTSDGAIYEIPAYIREDIYSIRTLHEKFNSLDLNSPKRINIQYKMHQTVDYLCQKMVDWFSSVSLDLISKYKYIYIENQPRIPSIEANGLARQNDAYPILIPGGIQFLGILHEKSKETDIKVKTVYKSMKNLHTCSYCGTTYSNPMIINIDTMICRVCKTVHNVSENAARNILKTGVIGTKVSY